MPSTRGYKVRQRFKEWRAIALAAVVKMQSVVRGRFARKLYWEMLGAKRIVVAIQVQSIWRGVMYVPGHSCPSGTHRCAASSTAPKDIITVACAYVNHCSACVCSRLFPGHVFVRRDCARSATTDARGGFRPWRVVGGIGTV